jgi:hypothetical protein
MIDGKVHPSMEASVPSRLGVRTLAGLALLAGLWRAMVESFRFVEPTPAAGERGN